MGMNTDAVQRLYVAYFNRPADPVSMSVYESLLPTDRVATQAELQVLAETYFSPSAEYTSLYAGMSNSQIVDQLYQNIFGRNAETDGLVYWAAELTAGRQTVASIALQLSYSAQGTDADVVANRIEAANAFTTGLDTPAEITGYSGDAAAASARTWLATVGSDDASKDAAVAGVDTAISNAVAAGTALPSQSFTLTSGRDDFTGATGDDTFDATAITLTAGDELDGGDGTDTLTIDDDVSGLNIAVPSVDVKNIENLVITTPGSVGVTAVAGVTGVDAVAQIRSITPTAVTGGSTSTLVVTYGTASFTTSALDGSATVGEVNALVSAALNAMAGSTIAAIVDGRVVATAPVAGTALPNITVTASTPADVTIVQADIQANVVGVTAVDAVAAAAYDVSGFVGLTDAQITAAGTINVKAATTADLTATTTAGKVTAVNGVDQTITAVGGYAVSGATGAIKVTDTAQGAVASTVDGGTTVDITSTSKNAGGTTGTITVGGTKASSGDVTVNSTISEAKGTTNTAGGAITITAGGDVDVTQTAVKALQTTAAANGTITNAAVTVTGSAATSDVTVKGTAAVTAVNTVLAVTAVTEVNTLTFAALAAGEDVVMNGLTFTAGAAGTTAAQTAAAFANLTAGATQGNSTLGVYSGAWSTQGWTSGPAIAGATTALDTVVFTATTAGVRTNLASTGTAAKVTTVVTTDGVDAVTATGTTGVTASTISITDVNNGSTTKAGAITDVTAHNYTTLAVNSNALTNLEILGGSGNVTIGNGSLTGNTATTLNLTVDGVTGGVLDDADVYTTLNVTTKYSGSATTTSSTLANITSTSVDDLNVSGDKVLILTSTAGMSGLINVDVNGTAGLTATFGAATMKTINTEGTTGTVTVTFDATKATYTGGAGVDSATTSAAAPTKAIDLGAGDDKLTLASGTTAVTGAISGGADSDTLSMVVADVVTADNDTAFKTLVTGFEVLELTGGVGAQAVDLSNMGITDKITVATGAGTLTIADIANDGLLTLTGDRAGDTVVLTNTAFATPTTDSMNIVMSAAAGFNGGTVTVDNVETVDLTATDTVTTAVTAHTLLVDGDKITTLNVDGNAGVTLTLTGSVKLALLDASNSTGAVSATGVSTAAITMKGGSAGDSLTATVGTNADTLIGNGGADTLTSNAGLTTLTGGAGLDLFVVNTVSAGSGVYTTITDAAAGDRIELFDKGTDVIDTTAVTLAPTATFTDYLNAAVAGYNGTTNGKIKWFQFEGNTYIVQDMSNAATYTDGTDHVVALTGLYDLSTMSLSTDGGGDPVIMLASGAA